MYGGESQNAEQRTTQPPIDSSAPAEHSTTSAAMPWVWQNDHEVERPEQLEMENLIQPPETTMDTQSNIVNESSLRHRPVQECSSWICMVPSNNFAQQYNQEGHGQQYYQEGHELNVDTEGAAQEDAQRLLAMFKAGGESRAEAIQTFEKWSFMSTRSSRACQKILEMVDEDAEMLIAGLRGQIRRAINSKHANYVVGKMIEALHVEKTGFIIAEIRGAAREVALSQFGCRILCRKLEHYETAEADFVALLDELFKDIEFLCSAESGSYVVRAILEFGMPQHVHRVVEALLKDTAWYAKDKFGSHVLEQAIVSASPEDRKLLLEDLFYNREQVLNIAGSNYGSHTLENTLRSLQWEEKKMMLPLLSAAEKTLKTMRFGKRVAQATKKIAEQLEKGSKKLVQ